MLFYTRHKNSKIMVPVIGLLIFAGLSIPVSAQFDSDTFFDLYDNHRIAPDDLMQMTPELVGAKVKEIAEKYPVIDLKVAGESVEGRPLYHLSFGTGNTRLLLWSQMHGDEPTATAALLSVFDYLGERSDEPFVKLISEHLQIHALIMLNPDGAVKFQRRNAQDIDINRDARLLQSPEGRTLKRLKDEVGPDYGFNLHDMGGRETVGPEKRLLSIAFMAPPFNESEEDSPSRIRAKKLIVVMMEALEPFIAGQMARYKADYMPRAFGDAMQNWGVSTVLIEAGMHDNPDPHFNVRMNFIALLCAFESIASNRVETADASGYETIPLEGADLFDVLIRDALIMNGSAMPPFRGDIGINVNRYKRNGEIRVSGKIADIGDLSITTGRKIIEGDDLVVTPAFVGTGDPAVAESTMSASGYARILPVNAEQENSEWIPAFETEWKIAADDLPDHTSVPAEKLGFKNLGLIKRGYDADLIIFKDPAPQILESQNIIRVLRNGRLINIRNR